MNIKTMVMAATLVLAGAAQADSPDYSYGSKSDSDACGAVLCLLGMSRDGDCDKYVTRYFSIVRTKHGKFSPSRTSEARGDFLAQCAEDQASGKQANDKWGGSKDGF